MTAVPHRLVRFFNSVIFTTADIACQKGSAAGSMIFKVRFTYSTCMFAHPPCPCVEVRKCPSTLRAPETQLRLSAELPLLLSHLEGLNSQRVLEFIV